CGGPFPAPYGPRGGRVPQHALEGQQTARPTADDPGSAWPAWTARKPRPADLLNTPATPRAPSGLPPPSLSDLCRWLRTAST
ncbi:hypothetical protein GTW37_29330, partial [Streptomyces sp. SID4931]